MSHRHFTAAEIALLEDPRRWRLSASATAEEERPVPDAAHRAWRLRRTHAHPHREMLFALAGDAPYGHARGPIRCRPGSLLYFDAHEPHDNGYPDDSTVRHLWMFLVPGWVGMQIFQVQSGRVAKPLPMIPIDLAELGFDPLLALERCRALGAAHPRLAALDLRTVVQALVARALEDGWRAAPSGGSAPARAIAAVRDHVRDHLRDGPSLGSLAMLTGYSRFHLARQFRRETGMSLGDWIDRCRLARARALTAAGATLAQAAPELGFASATSLSRWSRGHGLSWAAQRG